MWIGYAFVKTLILLYYCSVFFFEGEGTDVAGGKFMEANYSWPKITKNCCLLLEWFKPVVLKVAISTPRGPLDHPRGRMGVNE